ncbi:mitochondrial ribosomal protein L20 [Oratosquilla oratoria]|uniref:mitochondrial ribosomal protein L20 n=1 Tax=Oratosquilla oratoria TaxID=337810 RepID=UPI003F768E94
MVISSPTLFARTRNADRFWRRRRILSLSAHFFGRKKNCFSSSIRYVHRALRYSSLSKVIKKRDDRKLWETRIDGACRELGTSFSSMQGVLNEADIMLDRKTLQNLAVWEPRTFKSLAEYTRSRGGGLNSSMKTPDGIFTRTML